MKRASEMTGIGRSIDFDYPSNRAVFFLTLAVIGLGIGFRMIGGRGIIPAVLWGLGAGVAVFLAWALGREMDPDNDSSAFLAAGVALIVIFLWGIPSLGMLFWLLVAVRILNRTTGTVPTVLDSLVFLSLGGGISYRGNWIVGLLTAVVFLLDSRLPQGKRRSLVFAAMSAAASAASLIWGKELMIGMNISWRAVGIALWISVVFLPVILRSRQMKSEMDKTGEKLISVRIQAGQALAASFLILTALWGGMEALISVLPVGAAAGGAGVFYFFSRYS
ncbi:hypothetical protein KGY73_07890 [bacterium]|nr:hypothetical protein [bacterium]